MIKNHKNGFKHALKSKTVFLLRNLNFFDVFLAHANMLKFEKKYGYAYLKQVNFA